MLPVRHLTKLSFLDCFLSEMALRRGRWRYRGVKRLRKIKKIYIKPIPSAPALHGKAQGRSTGNGSIFVKPYPDKVPSHVPSP